MIPISEKILSRVRKWASRKQIVEQIWYSNGNLEETGDTLFVITDKFDFDLSGKISDLELAVMEEEKYNLHMLQWPCGRKAVSDYGFQELVYDKNKSIAS